jgi:hypothetical protein
LKELIANGASGMPHACPLANGKPGGVSRRLQLPIITKQAKSCKWAVIAIVFRRNPVVV